ncbi:hypothetical protein [Bradyrhizobium elkanii]|uniref:phage fiber-tail adaptor protein n=1 Tax=Bradyrhizobium elkanii TaxID=29448 RepID=UPI0008421991|nr:hypothetical protein [Bradyrhizobium elkanii]
MADRLVKSPRYPRTLLFWPAKAPEEAADYGFDWTDVLLSPVELASRAAGEKVAPSDGIKNSSYVLPPGIVASASSNTATATTVTLTGGVEGAIYSIVNRVDTAGGRFFERTVKLRVRAK